MSLDHVNQKKRQKAKAMNEDFLMHPEHLPFLYFLEIFECLNAAAMFFSIFSSCGRWSTRVGSMF
jgi:hypothetical protein